MQIAIRLDSMMQKSESLLNAMLQVKIMRFDPCSADVRAISTSLARYSEAQTNHFAIQPQYLSISSDKSRVLGRSLLSTVVSQPDGSASWAFPAVRGLASAASVCLGRAVAPSLAHCCPLCLDSPPVQALVLHGTICSAILVRAQSWSVWCCRIYRWNVLCFSHGPHAHPLFRHEITF